MVCLMNFSKALLSSWNGDRHSLVAEAEKSTAWESEGK